MTAGVNPSLYNEMQQLGTRWDEAEPCLRFNLRLVTPGLAAEGG